MPLKHSVFTVMTPEYSLLEAVRLIAELGYDGVEWRVHHVPAKQGSKPDFWSANKATVNIDTIDREAREIKKMTDDHGLEVVALGTYLSYKALDEVERCMAAAQIMGAGSIRVGAPIYDGSENYNDLLDSATEGYIAVEALAREYKVRATVEIHPRSICSSSSLAYLLVSNFDPDFIGVISDPGNMVTEGNENWQLGLELLGPYLSHVHVKNSAWRCVGGCEGDVRWDTEPAPLRSGCVSWKEFVRATQQVGFNGWLSLEDFVPGDTRAKLADDLAYLKEIEEEMSV